MSFFSLLSIFILAFSISGCGSSSNSAGETANNESTANGTSEETTTEASSYTVEHAMGSTTLENTPERVVILTNEGTEALLALGITPVGAVNSWTGDPWYKHISEQMEGVKELGTEHEPNLEAIAALKPDLIIGNKMRQEAIYDKLSAIAPTVFAEALRGDWKENFSLYAEALNKKEEGEQVLQQYEDRIAQFKEKASDKLNLKVSMIRFMGGEARIYLKNSFSGAILEDIGFARPESQNVDDFAINGVTKEMIPDMDGDILFYFTYETGDGEGTKLEQEWLNDPLFQKLPVVKNGHAYKVSDEIWNTAGGIIAAKQMVDELEQFILNYE